MKTYTHIYFIGIGGIGMSSLARYFNHEGYKVAGYDKTETPLTKSLVEEGIMVKYDDNISTIPEEFKDSKRSLIIYTPAIPKEHSELNFYQNGEYEIIKRAKALGFLSRSKYLMAVAGTHGKTSTSTMLAWFNHIAAKDENSDIIGGGSAFIGGISKNLDTNMLLGRGDRLTVEADEFDRSFLQLYPDVALVTSVDADHLDIYNDHDSLKRNFTDFTNQIKKGGTLIYREGIDLKIENKDISHYSYSLDSKSSDFYGENITIGKDGYYTFDVITPTEKIESCRLGIPGIINVENSIGAIALLWCKGYDKESLKEATSSFRGVKRRFDLYINTPEIVYIDDYAHHPREISATLSSIRALFPNREVTAIFQPHLFTRTRDFATGFSESLSSADNVYLLPIYPAREEPIVGINSDMLLNDIDAKNKKVVSKEELMPLIKGLKRDIIVTFGAGDIDQFCLPIYEYLKEEYNIC